jgi:hypothetical protein
MPFAGTRQLDDEPILITTYEGEITAEEVQYGSSKVAELMATIPGKVYAVVDLSTITTSFMDVLKILEHQAAGQEGTTTDPKLAMMVLVGSDNMVRLFTDAMHKRTDSVAIPIYRSVDKGIEALRVMIKRAQNDENVPKEDAS